MRLATHGHLIAAEDLADSLASSDGGSLESGVERDLDLDGRLEVFLAGPGQVVTIKPDEGAGIGAWDIRAARHALAAVMRRRAEAYHETLRAGESVAGGVPDESPSSPSPEAAAAPDEPASIHDLVASNEPDLAARLRYDTHERRSGLVVLLDPATPADAWADAEARVGAGLPDLANVPYRIESLDPTSATLRWPGAGHGAVDVRSRHAIGGGRLDPSFRQEVTVRNTSATVLEARLGLEWSMILLGGGGNPAAWWELDDERTTHDATRAGSGVTRLASGNDDVGLSIETTVEPPADVWIAPIETVSKSEAGYERAYQGSGLLLSWLVRLDPGEATTVSVAHDVTVTRDLAR
jgi:hypothetical protein